MNALLTSNIENVAIMQLEQRIDDLRERLDDASEGGLPDEAGIRQQLAAAESEMSKLKSPFTEWRGP